mmetsp:Transcript_255/g.651  ORF Transcript_255/g.651 Transcript_255/m.651 type:complete len:92 (+) Transcript_255:362-637(+)
MQGVRVASPSCPTLPSAEYEGIFQAMVMASRGHMESAQIQVEVCLTLFNVVHNHAENRTRAGAVEALMAVARRYAVSVQVELLERSPRCLR